MANNTISMVDTNDNPPYEWEESIEEQFERLEATGEIDMEKLTRNREEAGLHKMCEP